MREKYHGNDIDEFQFQLLCVTVEGAMSKKGSPSSSLCIVEIAINTNEGHILWGVAFKQNI
jgi:hypothetical protein